MLYSNAPVAGAAIVATFAAVNDTFGASIALVVIEDISKAEEAVGSVAIPTFPFESILTLSVSVALASGVVENVIAVGISAAELAAASRRTCICACGVVT